MKQSHKTLLLWGLLIMMFIAIWQFLSPEHPSAHPAPPDPDAGNLWLRFLLLVGGVVAFVVSMKRLVAAQHANNQALAASQEHLEAGRHDEAERALEPALRSRLPKGRRLAAHQRAEIAARRCLRDEALARVEAAIGAPFGPIFQGGARVAARDARGLRAFLRASAGDAAGAREDIAAVRAAEGIAPGVLARAELAEAMLLDAAGDRAALRGHLDRSRALVLEAGSPRERALVRAYEAMLAAPAASVYRQKASEVAAGTDDEQRAVAAWVACYAPNASPFVGASAGARIRRAGTAPPAEPPSEEARRKVAAARPVVKVKNTQGMKTLALWVALIVVFLGMWQVVGSNPDADWMVPALVLAVIGVLFGWLYVGIRRRTRETRRLNASARAIGLADFEAASAALAAEPTTPAYRAHACHLRAEIATRRGDMVEALAQCDLALAQLAEAQGGQVAQPAEPAAGAGIVWDLVRIVVAQRSFALATLGRGDEARAELEWGRGFPDALPQLRVRLVEKLRARDYEGATAVIQERDATLAMPSREEAVGELARFVADPEARGEAEAARLRGEIARTRGLERWIEAVAPGLLEVFRRTAAEAGTVNGATSGAASGAFGGGTV